MPEQAWLQGFNPVQFPLIQSAEKVDLADRFTTVVIPGADVLIDRVPRNTEMLNSLRPLDIKSKTGVSLCGKTVLICKIVVRHPFEFNTPTETE